MTAQQMRVRVKELRRIGPKCTSAQVRTKLINFADGFESLAHAAVAALTRVYASQLIDLESGAMRVPRLSRIVRLTSPLKA